MILAIDVGNSNIVLGCLDGRETRFVARIATDINKTEYEYSVSMRDVLAFRGVDVRELDGAILSSVVWPLNTTLYRAVELLIGKPPMTVGRGLKTGLDIRIDDPGTVGADLVVAAVAGLALAPPPLILIDMGTATTVTVVDAEGKFRGGAIAPGLRLSMEALSEGTSLLPRVSLEAPARCIGTNTVACMQSGAIFGTAAMLDGLIDRMEEELGQKTTVIATGGLAGCVVACCRREIRYEPDLLLTGLAILWEKNAK